MNKEELLEKARNSNENGVESIEQKQVFDGAKYGILTFCVLGVILMIYTVLKWRITEAYLTLSFVWLVFPANMYGMSRLAEKNSKPTKTMIVCFIIGLCLLATYFVMSW